MRKQEDIILLAHGGGGRKSAELLQRVIGSRLANPFLERWDDAACVDVEGAELAVTTDSYVVQPLFFPGGDIGRLAVSGTVNDLAMQGAEPRYLTLGLILEEGLAVADLERIVDSIAATAEEAGILVVAGDTKVVERGGASGVYINTTGIGVRREGVDTHVGRARPGDAVLVSGTIGDHGIAVMSRREGLEFESELVSDVAPLGVLSGALLEAVPGVRCLRDPTRGGVAIALNDIARASGVGIRIAEERLPVRNEVRSACGLLGLEPLNVANEGKMIVICSAGDAGRALDVMRSRERGRDACRIGEVLEAPAGKVLLKTGLGGERIVDVPAGEDLPRIC